MSCKYPLHPGQTEVSPYYVQVPMEEYESLKRENRQLHQLLNGVKSQNSDTEIDTLANECRILREMNTKAQEEIATLKENQRWRKCSEELPEEGVEVLVTNGVYCSISDWCGDYWNNDPFCGYTVSDNVIAWMPLPKYPEEK